jgi:hypothetical protein
MLKKVKEETDRCKHDIQGYQQKLLKNTPTPNTSQCQLHQLEEMQRACDDQHEAQATLFTESSKINRQSHRAHSHTLLMKIPILLHLEAWS